MSPAVAGIVEGQSGREMSLAVVLEGDLLAVGLQAVHSSFKDKIINRSIVDSSTQDRSEGTHSEIAVAQDLAFPLC